MNPSSSTPHALGTAPVNPRLPPAARERIADVLADYDLTWADLGPQSATTSQDWRVRAAALLEHPGIEPGEVALLRRVLGWRKLPADYRRMLEDIAGRLGEAGDP